jgi:hypothetical protein
MNKSLLALLLGVCLAGMGLIMYQEKQENSRVIKATAPEILPGGSASTPQVLSPVPAVPGGLSSSAPASLPQAALSSAAAAKVGESGKVRSNDPLGVAKPEAAKVNNPPLPVANIPERRAGAAKGREMAVGEGEIERNTALPVIPTVPPTPAISSTPPTEPATSSERAAEDSPAPAPAVAVAAPTVPSPVIPARAIAEKPAAPKSSKLVILARDKGTTVRLTNSGPVRYQTMTLAGPDRIVVDVTGVVAELKAPGVPKNPFVSNVRLGKNKDVTRIVIDLSAKPANPRFVLSPEKDVLDIRLD